MSPFNHFNNWQKYLRQLTEPAAEVQQGEERQWARLLAGLSVALLTMGIFVVIIWILISPNFTTAPYISGFAIAAIFSIYLLSRTRYYQFGAVCLIVLLLLIVGAIIFTAPGSLVDRMRVLYFLTIAVLLASLFFSIRGLLLVIGISLVGTAVFFFVPEAPFSVTYSYIVFMVVMSALLILATVMRNDYVKRLHESQRRYHALFNQSNDAVCIFGLDGRIIEANQHAVALLGYAPEELVGMTFRGVVVDNELIESEELFQRLRANEPIPIYEQWVKKKDGSLILVENNVELVQDANGNPLHIQSIARDITLRKQAEAALRASEERFRRLTFQSPDTIYILNFTNFQIEFINKDSFLGYTLAELKQSGSIFNNVHPTDQAQVAHYWETVMQNQEISPQSVDYRLQHKDGHWEWIHNRSIVLAHTAEGKPSEVLIVLTLITDTKQVEEKLRQQEEYARILIEQTPIGIVTVNMDGEVTAANPRSLEILGSPGLSATLGLNVLTLPPIVAAGISPMLAQSLATGKSNEMETWYTSIWDKATYLFIRAVPYFDGLGHQIGLIILVEDLTQRERAEEGMRQAQKLESLGVLAGGIAHDFNNLLVAMLGQASLALAKLAPKSPGRPHVEKAVTAAEQAARLTQQLLAYSGRGQFHVDLLDLNGLIEESLHLFTAMIPKQIILKTTLAELLPLVEVDIAQIQQVVMNLIINAVDALGSESGTIQIMTRTQMVTEADHQFWYYTSVPLAEGVYVTLEVSDDGPGMNQETAVNIFDPFFTTKEKGHGLGLAAVIGIVKGHNGGLTVESAVGQGTTFNLLLPVSQKQATAVPPAPKPKPTTLTGVILVIDDEQAVREAVTDILSLVDVAVLSAADGQSGLALYLKQQAEISLVLLDLSMPGWSGEKTMEALQAVNPDVQIIVSSGYNETEAIRRFANKGSTRFLKKPYSASTLIEMVQTGLRQ